MTGAPGDPLSASQPFPPPRPLPGSYRRHAPGVAEQRDVLVDLLTGVAWADLAWPELVDELVALGRTDIPLSRLAEGHVDALRILGQAGTAPASDALYGVWASRSAGTGLTAEPVGDDLRLSGTVRFASGAGLIDRALVPVWPAEDQHLLLDLDVRALDVDDSRWRTSAMVPSRTHEVRVDGLVVSESTQVGPPDFYLDRPGFAAGGVGVAACWVGGAARVVDVLLTFHPRPNPSQAMRLGEIRTDLVGAAAAVRSAAHVLEVQSAVDTAGVALETRAVVADAVRRLLAAARLLTGPTGLALDDDVAHAIPDLELYALQHNTDAGRAALGAGMVP